jgi:hypothetical protein
VFGTSTSGAEGARIRELEMRLLDIFVQLCTFEKQAGYMERGVAYFQALLEFNFFCPPNIIDYSGQMRSFANFWESEAPRVGDEGSVGWTNWVNQQRDSTVQPAVTRERRPRREMNETSQSTDTAMVETVPLPPTSEEIAKEEEEKKLFADWVKEEESREQHQW